uniref:EMAP like 3 n=1 Tax=Cyprinus carpio TaxID=7962 RepID=A0A8C2EB29_CYPCA
PKGQNISVCGSCTKDSQLNSCNDVSAESSTEFPDRMSLMEVRLQAQEDEITLLKSSLADALRKLRLHDQQIPLLKQQLIAGKSSQMKPRSNSAERRKMPLKKRWGRTKLGAARTARVHALKRQHPPRPHPQKSWHPAHMEAHSPPFGRKRTCCALTSKSGIKHWLAQMFLDLFIFSYGYRGRDCRANLYLLPSGEAVYFIACVVVLYHIRNQTQRHYQKHTDCVRVASGQTAGVDKDGKPLQPFVHIWDSKTLVTLQQIGLGTFERGVGALAFSSSDNGTFLCVIDDSNEHMISVWDWNKNIKHTEVKSTNEAVLGVDFSPTDTNNIISCGKSHVYFWTLSAGTLTKKQGIFGKYKKPKFVLCFVFSLTGDVLTGDSEGNILTWGKSAADTKTLGKGAKETFQIMKQTRAHEGSVFTMCILQGGAILSGGGKDRKIIRWSADLAPERECEIPEKFGAVRTIADVDGEELLVGTTRNAILRGTFSDGFVAIVQGHVDEMWGLATHPTQNIFITCGNDRQVCVWNAGDHKLDWCATLEESGLCADFSPNGAVVSVGLSTGRWVVLDLQTKEVVSDLTDGNEQLSVMRYSPDGSFLAVGSHDNFIYIYNVTEGGRRYTRFGKCTGHSSFITHLDWSKDGKYIMSNSGDYEILYWDVASGCKLLRNRFESKDREWASYTCVLGFHVMGVWLEGSDGTDINALCRSHSERMVAVADDFCKVHLFQYPCPKPKAPSYKYEGHGSHVTNVRFTHNDSHLLSMGGKDTCILQWRVKGAGTGDHSKEHLASSSSVCSSSRIKTKHRDIYTKNQERNRHEDILGNETRTKSHCTICCDMKHLEGYASFYEICHSVVLPLSCHK